MNVLGKIGILGLAALPVLVSAGLAAAYDEGDAGSAPTYVKKSVLEEKALKAAAAGANVQGESSGFDDYLNDDLFPLEEEIRLMDVDPNSRVVLSGDDGPTGVSFKKSYEKSPVIE